MTKSTPPHERLMMARDAKGYESAAEAARALRMPESTYAAHENGGRPFPRKAERFAKFFGVDLNWLMTGEGDMYGRQVAARIEGAVGPNGEMSKRAAVQLDGRSQVFLPRSSEVGALLVMTDDLYPRFLRGEYVLYAVAPQNPDELDGEIALVRTADGQEILRLISKINGRWMAEKFGNDKAAPVEIVYAWRYLGTLARAAGA